MSHQRRLSQGTFTLIRLEYLAALILCVGLAFTNIQSIRWGIFALFFITPDLLGYIPGLLAQRKRPGKPVHAVYPALYNITHNFLITGGLVALWCLLIQPEWALLAVPIHLCGDRALFGNLFKSRATPFEGPPNTTPTPSH